MLRQDPSSSDSEERKAAWRIVAVNASDDAL
jgi:hypothetical protein